MGPRAATRLAAMLIFFLTVSVPAFSEEVSGKIYLENRPFSGTLKLPDGTQIVVNNGNYRIFVPAGEYPVVFEGSGRLLRATIHSSTVPVNRDIYLPEK